MLLLYWRQLFVKIGGRKDNQKIWYMENRKKSCRE